MKIRSAELVAVAVRQDQYPPEDLPEIAFAGRSNVGKSTLLNIIGGIDNPDSGYISINGDKLEDMGEKGLTRYRRKHLGYVFQMYNLIPNLNVKENIEVGAYLSDNPLDVRLGDLHVGTGVEVVVVGGDHPAGVDPMAGNVVSVESVRDYSR